MRVARHLTASGRVQGVGYRAFVEREALLLRLDGWVRNRSDGTVEAVIAGELSAVESLIAACRRGPAHASVGDVAVAEWQGEEIVADFGFLVWPTL